MPYMIYFPYHDFPMIGAPIKPHADVIVAYFLPVLTSPKIRLVGPTGYVTYIALTKYSLKLIGYIQA